jgi:hypothetical protein
MIERSDYNVYIDESGDHGLKNIDTNYPIFVLTFCCFKISDYIKKAVPALQYFKFKYFGHDQVVLHEIDIRKNKEPFKFLRTDRVLRDNFMFDLSKIIEDIPFKVVPIIIDKSKLKIKYNSPFNPYHLGLRFGLEKLNQFLSNNEQEGKEVSLIFEKRGNNEDKDLELEFLRICNKNEQFGYKKINFGKMVYRFFIADKKTNSCGLQLADLTARPIGLKYLKPFQLNRAYDIIEKKKYGYKIFP